MVLFLKITKTAIKEFVGSIFEGLVIGFILWLVTSSLAIAGCAFAANVFLYIFKNKKVLKCLGYILLALPVFLYPFKTILAFIVFLIVRSKRKKEERIEQWLGDVLGPFVLYFIIKPPIFVSVRFSYIFTTLINTRWNKAIDFNTLYRWIDSLNSSKLIY